MSGEPLKTDLDLTPAEGRGASVTAGQLPPRLREEFELPFGVREQRIFRTSVRWLRPVIRHLPGLLRYNPMYVRALRRLAGNPRGHPVSETMIRILLAALQGPVARRQQG